MRLVCCYHFVHNGLYTHPLAVVCSVGLKSSFSTAVVYFGILDSTMEYMDALKVVQAAELIARGVLERIQRYSSLYAPPKKASQL